MNCSVWGAKKGWGGGGVGAEGGGAVGENGMQAGPTASIAQAKLLS